MNIKRYTLADIPKVCIPLGVAGEHLATRIEIDCTPWLTEHPDAVVALLIKQPDGNEYPVPVTMEGNVALWTLQSTDTGVAGYGRMEVRCNCPVGSQQYISVSGRTHLYPSINMTASGNPVQPWIDDVMQARADAQHCATGAAASANAAAECAAAAKADAEAVAGTVGGLAENAEMHARNAAHNAGQSKMFATLAEQSAATHGFFYTYIDNAGHLHYVRSDGLLDLNLRIEKGRLMASYGVA